LCDCVIVCAVMNPPTVLLNNPVFGEVSILASRAGETVDQSVVIPDTSDSQAAWMPRRVVASPVSGGRMILTPHPTRADCLVVTWEIVGPTPDDTVRLYIHNRLHDEKSLLSLSTHGDVKGSRVFEHLRRGYYDVRYFRGKATAHAQDIPVALCCVGEIVQMEVNVELPPKRLLTVRIPVSYRQGGNDWLALFPAEEHGNKGNNCVDRVGILARNATIDARNCMVFTMPLPRRSGQYQLRYFLQDSLSMWNGNVFSGFAPVDVPNMDRMSAVYADREGKLRISWQIHSVDPNDSQWIGIYDGDGKRIASDYVCYHAYDDDSKESGVVTLPRVENGVIKSDVPRELSLWTQTNVRPAAIRNWHIRFYNGVFSEIVTTPVLDVRFIPGDFPSE